MNQQLEYQVNIEEIHHTEKKDQPSGTAITLAKGILEEMNQKKSWVNEVANNEEELSIISKRMDKVPGTHNIIYTSPIDTIE